MSVPDEVDLSGDRKRLYRFVERHGPVEPSVVAETVGVDPESFQHHVSILERDDLLTEDREGRLRPRLQSGEAEEFSEAGVSYTVRPARPADFSGVVGVIRAVTEERTYITAETVAEEFDYEETLFRRTPTECRVVFVATVAEEVVGWAHVEAQEQAKLRGTAEGTVGVLEGYRRHGIGSHLLQRSVAWAASRGCRKVYDSIPATNGAAIDFLERNGWRIEAVREDHYEIDGELVDEVMLARRLDE
ncbi:GNAT family N-acetyltransferase [Halosimplex salinum]|uniref:GNAT family N-acetyltransferase n=1 Tax=Halosimplex salinum TaxID=1710538 RepID=UPI000F4881D7|nr:helix-turn-helix domain-containing GNAT family N-acetyltransferase [Halosimplex salinum]